MSKTEVHRLSVMAMALSDEPSAQELARHLGLELTKTASDPRHCHGSVALLTVDNGAVALQLAGKGMPGPVRVDFGAAAMRHRRRSGHNELLGKAVGVGKRDVLQVLDATAGLGRDSFVLADLGCRVTLCERNPVVACLLQRGLEQARKSEDAWLRGVVTRMNLHQGAAQTLMFQDAPDVIYLDPMFPQRDKSAAVKKDMALFQLLLEGDPGDEEELLAWALSQDVARVVVKRPAKAPVLGDRTPSHSIQGKAVRYDVHVKRSLAQALS